MRCLLAFFLTMAALASPGLRLEGGPFLPYRINQAVAVDDDGLLGILELQGLRWDGSRVPLFRTRVAALSQSVELAFYLDEDFRGLELRGDGPSSHRAASLDLAAAGTLGAEETALRVRMRGLAPPVHFAPDVNAPPRFALLGTDLVTAGFQASSALFGRSISRLPLMLLGAFTLAAWIASIIPPTTRRGRVWVRAVSAGTALVATVAVVYLAAPRAVFYSVAFPASGVVERRTEELPGYTRVAYRGPGAGTVELVGLWAPLATGVPVRDVVPVDAWVRFSSPPLVLGEGVLVSKDFVTGWVIHAEH